MKLTWNHLLWLTLFALFFTKAFIFLDPDFGWHYQMGKLISESGLPKTDQFSYTMPDFLYIDHEWLTDMFIYKIYSSVGTLGIAVLWSGMAMLTLFIATLPVQVKKLTFVSKNINLIKSSVILLGAGLIHSQFGIRPQIISWLFLSVLVALLSSWNGLKKIKLVVPLLFLVWVNMHGGFALGLAIFAIYLIVNYLYSKRLEILDWVIFLLSVLVTLINPYGFGLWKEVFDTFFSSSLRTHIEEWGPIWTGLNICYPFVLVLSLILIFRFKKSFTTWAILVYAMLLAMSISAIINLPFFTIVLMPILVNGLLLLEKEIGLIKFGKKRFKMLMVGFLSLSAFLFIFSIFFSLRAGFLLAENKFYPKDAITFISSNLPQGEIFSDYNWGGYLIWKLPQKKVFIDGRMAHWPEIINYQSQILVGELDYKDAFEKYNIQMVLWPKNKKFFTDRIKDDGWQVVYSDKVSEIFVHACLHCMINYH